MEWMFGQEEYSALGVALQCQYAQLKADSSLSDMVAALRSNSHLTSQSFKRMKKESKFWILYDFHKFFTFVRQCLSPTGPIWPEQGRSLPAATSGAQDPSSTSPVSPQTTPPLDWFSVLPSLRSLIVRSVFKFLKIYFISPWVSICLCECMCTYVGDYACLCRYTGQVNTLDPSELELWVFAGFLGLLLVL